MCVCVCACVHACTCIKICDWPVGQTTCQYHNLSMSQQASLEPKTVKKQSLWFRWSPFLAHHMHCSHCNLALPIICIQNSLWSNNPTYMYIELVYVESNQRHGRCNCMIISFIASAYAYISITTRARDFKFEGAAVQRLQLVMVALTQNRLSAHYAWFCHGRSQMFRSGNFLC